MNDTGRHVLLHIHRQLQSKRDPRRLYESLTEMVRAALSADSAALLLWKKDELRLMARVGEPFQIHVGQHLLYAERLAEEVARSGLAQRSSLSDYDPELLKHQSNPFDESLLTVPLFDDTRVLGVLQVVRANHAIAFDEDDQAVLEFLGHHVTVLLEQGDLYQQAEKRVEWIEKLYSINMAITSASDLDAITETFLQQLGSLFSVEQIDLLLLNQHQVQRRSWTHERMSGLELGQLPQPMSLVARVLADGTPRIEPRKQATGRRHTAAKQSKEQARQEVFCIALRSNQTPCGAIEMIAKQGYSFGEAEIQFMIALARPLAFAIEQARQRADTIASEALNRALLEAASDGILLLDSKGQKILDANHAMEQLSGYSRSILQRLSPGKLFGEAWQSHFTVSLHQLGLTQPFDTVLFGKEKQTTPVSVGISSVPYEKGNLLLLIIRDISHQQRMASQLVQAEKLAAIGRLASSIAHEVNNPLQAIYNSLDLLRKNEQMPAEKRQRYLELTYAEAEHLIDIVKRLIDLNRSSRDGMRPLQLSDLLDSMLDSSSEQLAEHKIKLVRDWHVPQSRVLAIHSHIKQVCQNLISNAVDAMPRGGTLTVRMYQERPSETSRSFGLPEELGSQVIEFQDTGDGISPEDLTKIFEPFYTTKASGGGLSLSTSYHIVQQHGGELSASSTPGVGTLLRLRLPAIE
jgi:PAS domain S-box-containing protein